MRRRNASSVLVAGLACGAGPAGRGRPPRRGRCRAGPRPRAGPASSRGRRAGSPMRSRRSRRRRRGSGSGARPRPGRRARRARAATRASIVSMSSAAGTTSSICHPFVVPTSMYSISRRTWPVPRKCSAMSSTEPSFRPRFTTMLTLTGRPASAARVDALEHPLDREVDVVHRAEHRIVERVEADGHAAEAGVGEGSRLPREERPVGRHGDVVDAVDRREHRDEPLEVAPQERLAAGEAELLRRRAARRSRPPGRSPRTSGAPTGAGTGSRARTPPWACSRRSGSRTGP